MVPALFLLKNIIFFKKCVDKREHLWYIIITKGKEIKKMKKITLDELNKIWNENGGDFGKYEKTEGTGFTALQNRHGTTVSGAAYYTITDEEAFKKYVNEIRWDNATKIMNADLYEIAEAEGIL